MLTTTEIKAKAIAKESELKAIKADLETTFLLKRILTSNGVWEGGSND